ncbi:MFS family permease [Anaerotaenia torta]
MIGQLRRIYFMALPESKQDLKSSRVYYTTADSAAQTIAQLAGGTFLTALMAHSGISDANIGIITSLVSFAALTQLFLINFFKRIKKYKFLVTITSSQRILFAALYFVPILMINDLSKTVLIVLMYFIGQIFVQIGTPASQDWIASLVPSRLRGKYFSIKDSVAVFVVSSLMLLCGMILDYFKKVNIVAGFLIIGVIIFILAVINIIALSLMKEPKLSYMNEEGKEMHGRLARKAKEKEPPVKSQSILSEIKEAVRDRRFRKAFSIQCIYTLAFYICTPFNSSYIIKVLSLPYTFIMLVSFVFNLYRIYITPRLGRMADKYGMGRLLRYTLLSLGLNFLTLAFTMPFNAYPMYLLATFFGSTAWAFVGIGLFGIQLDFYRSDKRMIWLTLTSSVSGLFGFIVSILSGSLLSRLQQLNLVLFGQKIYAQQFLNLLGFLVLLCAVFFIRYRIETEKVAANREDGRVKL